MTTSHRLARLRTLWAWLSERQMAHPNAAGPSYREIKAALGWSSVNIVEYWLLALEQSGYIALGKPRTARTIHVVSILHIITKVLQ